MLKNRTLATSLAVLLAVSLVAGCATTQTPREQVNDNTIQAKVKTKLTADKFSNIVNVDVNVTNGVVTLAGEVPDAQVKADAEREVWSVSGVKQVVNNLQVSGGAGTRTGGSK